MAIIVVLLVTIVVLTIVISMQSPEFSVSRSAKISAPAEAVFTHVNNLHKWESWSPWAKLDPTARNSFEGPEAGVGAITRWVGNCKVGEGSMTITESRNNEFIKFKLDFLKPMKTTSTAEFVFKQDGNQTDVTWNMYGKRNFMSKAMGMLFNCDKMVGGQFEKGLADMKTVVEAQSKK